jgi:hypothetical protein
MKGARVRAVSREIRTWRQLLQARRKGEGCCCEHQLYVYARLFVKGFALAAAHLVKKLSCLPVEKRAQYFCTSLEDTHRSRSTRGGKPS